MSRYGRLLVRSCLMMWFHLFVRMITYIAMNKDLIWWFGWLCWYFWSITFLLWGKIFAGACQPVCQIHRVKQWCDTQWFTVIQSETQCDTQCSPSVQLSAAQLVGHCTILQFLLLGRQKLTQHSINSLLATIEYNQYFSMQLLAQYSSVRWHPWVGHFFELAD